MGNLTLLKYGDPLRAVPPDYSVDVEGAWPPAGWTSWGIGGGSDVTQSAEWKHGGSYSAKIVAATAGSATARAIDSLAIPTTGYRMSAFIRLVSIASDNTSAHLFFTGQKTSPYYNVGASVDRRAGKYYWALVYFYGGAQRVTTNIEMQLNTDYYVEFGTDNPPSGSSIWMKVNGVLVASVQAPASVALTYCGIGAWTGTYAGVYTAYVDDVMVHDRPLRFSYGDVAADGSYVHCAAYKTSHGSSDGVVKCFRSIDQGVTWNLQQTISVSGHDASAYSFAKYGAVLYLTVGRYGYGAPHTDQSTIYKSTDNGQSWNAVCAVDDAILFFPSDNITDGTKLRVVACITGSSWNISTIKIGLYDTADDSYTLGALIATYNDFPLVSPNEPTLYKNSTGNIAALPRWDDNVLPDQLFLSAHVSADDGATFGAPTNLSALWGMVGGTPTVVKIGSHYYLACYERSGGRHKSKIFEFNPDTYEKIGADEYPMGNPPTFLEEGANGRIAMGPVYNQLVHTCDAGSSGFYLYEVAGITPPPSGGKTLLDGFDSSLLEGALMR